MQTLIGPVGPSPLEVRGLNYNAVFGGEYSVTDGWHMLSSHSISLAGLSRQMPNRGAACALRTIAMEGLEDHVGATLRQATPEAPKHDNTGNGTVLDLSIPTHRAAATEVVSAVLKTWERASAWAHRASPLADPEAEMWLIRAVAATLPGIHQRGVRGFDVLKPGSSDNGLARMLARTSPSFIQSWQRGEIVTQWLEQTVPFGDVDAWSEFFTPSIRTDALLANVSDPLERLKLIKHHMDVTLSDQNIIKELGWTQQDISVYLRPFGRREMAVRFFEDPLTALKTYRNNLEHVMTDQAIARAAGCSEDEVSQSLTMSVRRQIALSNLRDPIGGCINRLRRNSGRQQRVGSVKHINMLV